MTLGVIILAHRDLNRVTEVARFWASHDCPVVVHVDANTPSQDYDSLAQSLREERLVQFTPRVRVKWGSFRVVQATNNAVEHMLQQFPHVERIMLSSGSCLPLRAPDEIKTYFEHYPDTDFIESVHIAEVPWAKGGLEEERFTLRFPFSWKSQRKLFDAYVTIQRWLGFRRRIPKGLVPHSGSQWWCLTRTTLEKILGDPRRAEYERYFKKVWIPDESYLQTLVRQHSDRIESRSLTLSKFDQNGRPHVFYDDHLGLLQRSDCFMVRKVWPHADALYSFFLGQSSGHQTATPPNPGLIDRLFSRSHDKRVFGRAGLFMQGRFPDAVAERALTAEPYVVFEGFDAIFPDFEDWLSQNAQLDVHGHLFAPTGAQFKGRVDTYIGGLSSSPTLRDYNARAFLCNLVWNTKGRVNVFQHGPADAPEASWEIALNRKAYITVITGAWLVKLWKDGLTESALLKEAARLQRRERKHLEILRSRFAHANIRIWSLAEFLEAPHQALSMAMSSIPEHSNAGEEPPKLLDLTGFDALLQKLRNAGTHVHSVGHITADTIRAASSATNRRDYLTR